MDVEFPTGAEFSASKTPAWVEFPTGAEFLKVACG
jgi:hypothetical protein